MTIEDPLWMQGSGGSPSYSAREDRLLLDEMWDEGVRSLAHFKVSQRAAGANFSVDVSAGVAVVKGDDQTDQGSYLVRSTAVENVTIGAAPGANSRYDILCLRINDPNAGGNAGYTATLVVTAGTPSSTPTVPPVPASSLLLAVIGPIGTATASITTSLIHDAQTGTGPSGVAAAHLLRGERAIPGTPADWFGPASTVPNGWLLCDGSSLLRSAYPDLFATIGTTYGAADGTHFNLPDCRGRVGVGLDNMGGSDAGRLSVANTLGGVGGEEQHTLSTGEMPAHGHTQNAHSHSFSATTSSFSFDHSHTQQGTFLTTGEGAHTHDPGGGTAFMNTPGGFNLAGGGGGMSVDLSSETATDGSHAHFVTISGATTNTDGSHSHTVSGTSGNTTATNQNTGGGGAHNNMQPYLLVNKIIRT